MRPVFNEMEVVGEEVTQTVQSVSYGFIGLLLFVGVGLNADLEGLFREPTLAILLYLAGTIGKLVGVFLMVPMRKLTVREAWTVGIGLDARLTTEIIVARLLFDARLIDGGSHVVSVTLEGGEKIPADMVLISIGAKPASELAQKAGLRIVDNDSIWVDDYMRTEAEEVFAVGDCALKRDFFYPPGGSGMASIYGNCRSKKCGDKPLWNQSVAPDPGNDRCIFNQNRRGFICQYGNDLPNL